jgi:hypothetical protein
MKVALAPSYRTWMLALLPATLGVGTAALWLRSLSWPLNIDADGLTLRYHRRLPWSAIKRIGVSRGYLDGHVCEMRIHHHGGVSRIRIRELRDGDEVAGMILTMFKRTRRAHGGEGPRAVEPTPDITRFVVGDQLPIDRLRIQDAPVPRHPPVRDTLVKIQAEITNVVQRPRDDCSRDERRVGRIPSRATR